MSKQFLAGVHAATAGFSAVVALLCLASGNQSGAALQLISVVFNGYFFHLRYTGR